ncbi:DUF4232 domain-containing protein [Arthrobacter cupressi]|uniref:DUF4232 domain-containing protein n=1 Tax=Arthrobacter cupressi TaxID=1045773 RepID=A0A1G8V4T5_9MICC|nr:DUF4232 domain-containing protein [Arthrobacter cupressi]NYD78690.1 hypothetical protein [Arthrobacter cupressi]SDJ61088.1 Protein of unknown function [Arthrobacter cupressi]
MTTARATKAFLFTTAAATLLMLAGCGQGQNPSSATSSTTTPSTSQSPSDNSPSGPASATGSASGSASATAATLCKSTSLTPSVDSTGGGAAGSVYQKLILTNSGTTPCILKGYPGVSLVTGPTAGPIGAPADRDTTKAPVELLLQPGESGAAVLRYTQAGLYPDCTHAAAAGFRIYPPEDTGSVFIAQQHEACSNASVKLLTIQAFQAN